MDRLTAIETALKDVLLTIDSNTTTANGYTYYNTVNVVNIDDEAIADEYGDYPIITIYLEPNEIINAGNQSAFQNTAYFNIKCKVINDAGVENPRFQINQKLNTILSDIKEKLSANYHLNDTCDLVTILNSRRAYLPHDDEYHAGDLYIAIQVQYTQMRLNPNRNTCI